MIYLDYNATTPLCDAARKAMLPYLEQDFGNPSSVHAAGREARAAIDNARDKLALLLHAKPHELIFTSGGTESCNLAVLGLARNQSTKRHLISAKTEHHAVLNAVEHLEKRENFEVTWLNVSPEGLVDLDQLADSIRDDTALVSIMAANNETGIIQRVAEISKICRERGVLLHSDMVQSFGKLPLIQCFAQDDSDLLSLVGAASFAAHKFYGPKGAGFLFLRSGLSIQPIMFGGAHENERRPGTENVAAIAGMAAAAEWTLGRGGSPNRQGESEPDWQGRSPLREFKAEQDRQLHLRENLWDLIVAAVPGARQNAEGAPRLANTLNVSFLGIDSEMMLIALDLKGICASSGSACMVGSVVASHVLLAMGLPLEHARSAVRFSLGKQTTSEEIKAAGEAIAQIVERLTKRKSEFAVA